MYFLIGICFLKLTIISVLCSVIVSAQEVSDELKDAILYQSERNNFNDLISNNINKILDTSYRNELIAPVLYSSAINSRSVPTSFAFLVNFGIDGRKRTLFSSKANDQECGDKQIWDPFTGHCRQLYCSAHFTLVGFSCVETNSETNITKTPVIFIDSDSQFVNITLRLYFVQPINDIIEWINDQNISFEEEFKEKFTENFASLERQRIANVTYVDSNESNKFVVNFILLESNNSVSHNTNNDAILQVMSSAITQNALSFDLYGKTVKAYWIHTTISEYNSFCNSDSDLPILYWNSEFEMRIISNTTYLYVNDTARLYRPGQYLVNILYVQNMDMLDQLEPNKVNVSSNALVCETQTLINESCTRILLNHSEYEWINDSPSDEPKKLITKDNQIHDKYELAPNGVFVCFEFQTESYIQDMAEAILSTVLIAISITALTCVLITYVTFSCLRSTINGFNTINLVLCLELMQIVFLTSPYIMDCRIAAIILHYSLLLSMSWSSVIAYDMYRTFGVRKFKIRYKNVFKLRLIYWFLANIFASIVVSISLICEKYNSALNPDYGDLGELSGCWIRNSWATFLFFGTPLTINIVVNLILYLMTVCQVRTDLKTSDSLRKITRIPSDSSETSNGSSATAHSTSTNSTTSLSQTSRPNQVLIFTRLGVLMGFTWIIALIIALIPEKYETVITALSYIFVICNTSQGVVLFIAFLCNTKVAKLWTNLFNRRVK